MHSFEGAGFVKNERSMYDLKLASGSPRRRELLEMSGWNVMLCPVSIDESPLPNEESKSFVKRLAFEKAEKAVATDDCKMVVLGADTIVVQGDRILGKPIDMKDAEVMLEKLKGKVHQVLTAIALVNQEDSRFVVDCCETDVPIRPYNEEEIKAYIASESPLDKAGAYGIQDEFFHPVDIDSMAGCYANVMGLPLCHLARAMKSIGVDSPENIPERCMAYTRYNCQVYTGILSAEK
jgi:septum formation protein